MKKLILTSILLLFNGIAFSQNVVLTILDTKTQTPIDGVHVKTDNKVYVSDEEGKIRIENFKEGIYYFSHLQYIAKEVFLKTKKQHTLLLTQKENVLEEILISKNRKRGIEYETLPPMEKGVYGFASVLYEGKIYVFGGESSNLTNKHLKALEAMQMRGSLGGTFGHFLNETRRYHNNNIIEYNNKLYVYDIAKKVWSISSLGLMKRAYHKAVRVEDKVFLFGGIRLSKNKTRTYLDGTVEVFNLKTNTLEKTIESAHKAVNSGVANVEDAVILVGGSTKSKKKNRKRFSNDVKLYNTSENKWFSIGKLPDPKETTCVVVNNKLYSIGGFNNNELSTITSFNLKKGTWKIEKKLPVRIKNATVKHRDHTIFVFNENRLYIYDTISNDLKEYKVGLPYQSSEMFVFNDKLYILGGFERTSSEKKVSKGLFSIDLEEFDTTKYKVF